MNMLRPVPRVNGLDQKAPGGAPVGMNYVQMLAAASARRVGVNGTRGLYNAVVGKGPGVTVVPLLRTPAQGVLYSARSMWATGTTKVGPGGARGPGLAGIAGLGTTEDEARSHLGTPKQANEWITESSKDSLWNCQSYTHKRACEIGQKGMEGACKPCGTPFGSPATAVSSNPAEAATLRSIKDVLSQFEARLRAGSIDPDSSYPTGTDPIAPLSDESNRSLYNDVTTLHDTLIPGARTVGRMYRSLNSASSGSSSSTTTTTGGSGTTTTQDPQIVYVQQPSSGSSSDDPYLTNIPNDLYGGAVDPVTGTVAPPSSGPGTVTRAPSAAPAIATKRSGSAAAIGLGVLALVGVAVVVSRRKKRSR